jgi:putative membrane protein
MMMGIGVIGLALMLLFWGGLIIGALFLIRALFPGGQTLTTRSRENFTARHTLEQRYARGEITREEFELIRQDIGD